MTERIVIRVEQRDDGGEIRVSERVISAEEYEFLIFPEDVLKRMISGCRDELVRLKNEETGKD